MTQNVELGVKVALVCNQEMSGEIQPILKKIGFKVHCFKSIQDLLKFGSEVDFSYAVVDIQENSIEFCADMVSLSKTESIVFVVLTKINSEIEEVFLIDLVADILIRKPCYAALIAAHMRAHQRYLRKLPIAKNDSNFGDISPQSRYSVSEFVHEMSQRYPSIDIAGELQLTSGELILLELFLNHPNKVVEFDEIKKLYKKNNRRANKCIYMNVSRLRRS